VPLPVLAVEEEMIGADWMDDVDIKAMVRAFAPFSSPHPQDPGNTTRTTRRFRDAFARLPTARYQ
jgi:hypothetical protein